MSRILLADDSPHAQRMGERILLEEGFEVVSVTDGETALLRLHDVDPDLVLADVFLPRRSGFDICRYVKTNVRHKHARVILTAGLLEPFDEEEAKRVGCDAILKKPFEASLVMRIIRPLMEEAAVARLKNSGNPPAAELPKVSEEPELVEVEAKPVVIARDEPMVVVVEEHALKSLAPEAEDPLPEPEAHEPLFAPAETLPDFEMESGADPERVRAAVTLALEAALPSLIDEITDRIMIALRR